MRREQAYGVYIWHKPQGCLWTERMVHGIDAVQALHRAQDCARRALMEANVPVSQWGEFTVEFDHRAIELIHEEGR